MRKVFALISALIVGLACIFFLGPFGGDPKGPERSQSGASNQTNLNQAIAREELLDLKAPPSHLTQQPLQAEISLEKKAALVSATLRINRSDLIEKFNLSIEDVTYLREQAIALAVVARAMAAENTKEDYLRHQPEKGRHSFYMKAHDSSSSLLSQFQSRLAERWDNEYSEILTQEFFNYQAFGRLGKNDMRIEFDNRSGNWEWRTEFFNPTNGNSMGGTSGTTLSQFRTRYGNFWKSLPNTDAQ